MAQTITATQTNDDTVQIVIPTEGKLAGAKTPKGKEWWMIKQLFQDCKHTGGVLSIDFTK